MSNKCTTLLMLFLLTIAPVRADNLDYLWDQFIDGECYSNDYNKAEWACAELVKIYPNDLQSQNLYRLLLAKLLYFRSDTKRALSVCEQGIQAEVLSGKDMSYQGLALIEQCGIILDSTYYGGKL